MSAHIFITNEENFIICKDRGIVALPETEKDHIFDALLSRIACIKEDDYILIYVVQKKELHGVWKADGLPFYEETEIWKEKIYPFRCKIKTSEYCFDYPLQLNDINDLSNNGKIWTWRA